MSKKAKLSTIYLPVFVWRVIWISSDLGEDQVKIAVARWELCDTLWRRSLGMLMETMLKENVIKRWWLKMETWNEGIDHRQIYKILSLPSHMSPSLFCTLSIRPPKQVPPSPAAIFFKAWMWLYDNILKRETLRLKINMKRLTAQFAFLRLLILHSAPHWTNWTALPGCWCCCC